MLRFLGSHYYPTLRGAWSEIRPQPLNPAVPAHVSLAGKLVVWNSTFSVDQMSGSYARHGALGGRKPRQISPEILLYCALPCPTGLPSSSQDSSCRNKVRRSDDLASTIPSHIYFTFVIVFLVEPLCRHRRNRTKVLKSMCFPLLLNLPSTYTVRSGGCWSVWTVN